MTTTWTEPAVAGAVVDALLAALDSSSAALAVTQGTTLADLDYEEGEWTVGLLLSDGRTFELRVSEVRPVPANIRCGATFTTGGADPYGTDCDLPPHHDGKHSGLDPFGNDGRVRWNGGGSCAGDPLPYRDVEYIGGDGR